MGIRDILCESALLRVYCHAYQEAWASTPSWTAQNPHNYATTALSYCDIRYSIGAQLSPIHRYQFDITDAVKNWKNNPSTKNYGIIFKASEEVENGTAYIAKTMASFNRASYQPNLTVNYRPAVILSPTTASITVGETVQLTAQIIPNDDESSVTYVSSTPGVASVSESGLVTGLAQGMTVISALIDGVVCQTCNVTVTPVNYSIEFVEKNTSNNWGKRNPILQFFRR